MLLASGDQMQVTKVAQNMLDQIVQPMDIEWHSMEVGCSMGIAVYPLHGEDAETLLRHADVAMYRAKRARKGPVIYEFDQDDPEEKQLLILHELPLALVEQQLILRYQPQINTATRKAVAVDTIITWQHPKRGLLEGQEFLPFAERAGLMPSVTRWLIQTAVKQCGRWLNAGIELKISIPVSAQDLLDENLAIELIKALKNQDISVTSISLSVCDDALIKSPQEVFAALVRWRELGIEIAIRQFGRGYFSLTQFKDLPISELKLDKSFIQDVASDSKVQGLIGIMLAFGQQLGLKVSAQGVDTKAVLNKLSAMGCLYAQGDQISEALMADDLVIWLSNYSSEQSTDVNAESFAS